jgi:transposase InsO family protein
MGMYTTNPNMPKVRRKAVNMVKNGHSIRKTARYFGFNPSTISRWVKKAPDDQRCNIWTKSSRPINCPRAIDSGIVELIVKIRKQHGRCAEVIHQQLKNQNIKVSLSSVKRTLDRKGLLKKRSPWKRRYISVKRPKVNFPGDLVQIDTIHVHSRYSDNFYIYTMIDVNSRFAYAMVSTKINTHQSLKFIKKVQSITPFNIKMIQSDNGPEFTSWFTEHVQKLGIAHRHSRVRKPNDNAYIERFNRTLKEEGLKHLGKYPKTYSKNIKRYLTYYNSKRLHLGINLLTPLQVLPSS